MLPTAGVQKTVAGEEINMEKKSYVKPEINIEKIDPEALCSVAYSGDGMNPIPPPD